jgi:hypothetical protein
MAELEIVGFDSAGTELEAPQGADTYVAKKAITFEQPVTADQPINGRRVDIDGTKLDLITVTSAVDLDALSTAVGGMSAIVTLVGAWDPTATGQFPASTVAGESWIVDTSGTVDGVDFTVNDRILAIVGAADPTVYSGQWLKLDYSDLVTSVAGKTGNIVLEEADISDLGNYLGNSDIDTLDKLNTILTDATLVNINPPTIIAAATHELAITDSTLHVLYVGTGQCAITLMSDQVIAGRFITVKNVAGIYDTILDCEGAETIDGETTLVISGAYDAVNLYTDGTNWFIY